METPDPNQVLMAELTPEIEKLYNRHLNNAKEWYPHELIPYDLGRDYKGEPWQPENYPLPDAVRSALFVNLLTEDNLPYYYETINSRSPAKNHVWGQWARHWTSEENRHSTVIRDWVHVTRALDPNALEEAKRSQMQLGQVPDPPTLPELLAYVSLQELATRVAHSNTGRVLDKEHGGKNVMSQVAADEGLHHIFYRDLSTAAFNVDPSAMVIAAFSVINDFKMPGTGILDFEEHKKAISKAGIYDIAHFKENVVDPTIKHWDIEHLEGLSPKAEEAREKLVSYLERLGKIACIKRARREEVLYR